MSTECGIVLKDVLGPIVQAIAAFIAISGVALTAWNNRRNQYLRQAHDAYEAYSRDALANAKLATGRVDIPVSYETAQDEFFKYEWLVSRLLGAGDQILELQPNDDAWFNTIKNQVTLHKAYLQSEFFGQAEYCMYSEPVKKIICDVVGEAECKKLETKPREVT